MSLQMNWNTEIPIDASSGLRGATESPGIGWGNHARAIVATVPEWYTEVIPATFHEAYVKRHSDWRLNKEEVLAEVQKVGRDGFWLGHSHEIIIRSCIKR